MPTFSGTWLGESVFLSWVCVNSWVRTQIDLGKEPLDRLTGFCDCPGFPPFPSNHAKESQEAEATRTLVLLPAGLGCCLGLQAHFLPALGEAGPPGNTDSPFKTQAAHS